jgi:hypothetical protein
MLVVAIEPGVHLMSHLKPPMKLGETPRESKSSVMKNRWNKPRSWRVASVSGEIAFSAAEKTA